MASDGRTAYAAVSDGYATLDLSEPAAPRLLAERRNLLPERTNGPLETVWDVKSAGDRLAVVGPAASSGETLKGVLFVDVSDPSTPIRTGFYSTDFPIHNCYFDGEYCYLTANDGAENPVVIVDADTEPPVEVGRWSPVNHDDRLTETPVGIRPLHDLCVTDDIAYLAYWDAGTWLTDVSDPTSPTYLGHVEALPIDQLRSPRSREGLIPPGNHHFVATNADGTLLGIGKESWGYETDSGIVGGPSGIDLYDVTDPTSPALLTSIDPPPTPNPTYGGVWTTAHNFGFRDDFLYTSWYQGGVKRFDVSDPASPTDTAAWRAPETTRFWTAQPAGEREFFVASTMGIAESPAGVFVFPDRSGRQPSAPPLTTAVPETRSPTATDSPSPPPTTSRATTRTTGQGFGLPTALGAVGLGSWWALRKRRSD